MKTWLGSGVLFSLVLFVSPAWAVSEAQDIATTIMLRGYACGGQQVSQIDKQADAQGNQVIRATCPNGQRYQIDVSAAGRVKVKPL